MPNIIEQQELLKGLPDTKIAMLLQNPVGAIPPFLVAAEAQRRQSIRQQFAGPAQNESVVDTLTKQIANVPQNIQGKQTATPPVPPTPEMQGVMALQQQQAMQQAAQQAMQPQAMRDGGMVQRYQDQGLVQRYYRYGPRGAGAPPPKVGDTSVLGGIYDFLFPQQTAPAPSGTVLSGPTVEDIAEQAKKIGEPKRIFPQLPPGAAGGMALTKPPAIPRNTEAGKEGTSPENVQAASDSTPEELRKRLEELYGETGLSDWEKAQKWFAASQQFLEPDQTLMQSIVGAASAFAGGAAQERAAEREARLAEQKGLLEWDIARYEADQKERSDIARDKLAYERELQKMQILSPSNAIEGYNAQIKALENRLENTIDQKEKDDINLQLKGLYEMIATIMRGAGYGPKGPASVAEMQAALGQ